MSTSLTQNHIGIPEFLLLKRLDIKFSFTIDFFIKLISYLVVVVIYNYVDKISNNTLSPSYKKNYVKIIIKNKSC